MKSALVIAVLGALALVAGCDPSVKSSDQERLRKEFSTEKIEQAAVKAGKQEELEAAKQREAEYLRAGGGDQSTQ